VDGATAVYSELRDALNLESGPWKVCLSPDKRQAHRKCMYSTPYDALSPGGA
jgi:hypothetical protein